MWTSCARDWPVDAAAVPVPCGWSCARAWSVVRWCSCARCAGLAGREVCPSSSCSMREYTVTFIWHLVRFACAWFKVACAIGTVSAHSSLRLRMCRSCTIWSCWSRSSRLMTETSCASDRTSCFASCRLLMLMASCRSLPCRCVMHAPFSSVVAPGPFVCWTS